MPQSDPEALSDLFEAIRRGEDGAQDRLMEAVYIELKRIARKEMARERPSHTLQPTALVHEAWLRMLKDQDQDKDKDKEKWAHKGFFFTVAAKAMRRVLIDHARAKKAKKRDFGVRVTFDDDFAQESPDIEALDEALTHLEAESPRMAQVVELRYFTGLTIDETAEELGVSKRTINDDWHYARAWLKREIARGSKDAESSPER